MAVDWHGLARSYAQEDVGPSGCVALCPDGGGGSGDGGGGGGCATFVDSDAAVGRDNSRSIVAIGIHEFNDGDLASAASLFQSAVEWDCRNDSAVAWLAVTLNDMGVGAARNGNKDSAYLYYERAIETEPGNELFRNNIRAVRRSSTIQDEGSKNCSVCGRALINDVAFGLNNSASLWHYVNQASINYRNCTRRISDFCEYTPGRSFFDIVREGCAEEWISDENALRGCVGRALADVR